MKTGKDTGSYALQQIEFGLDVKTAIADLQVDMNRVSMLIGQLSYVNSVSGEKTCRDFHWSGGGVSAHGGCRPIQTRFKR